MAVQPMAKQVSWGPSQLLPTTAATTVRKTREPLVLDGPFAETRAVLALRGRLRNLEEVMQFVRELCAANPARGPMRSARWALQALEWKSVSEVDSEWMGLT